MRILHIGKFYPPDMGGMETYLRDLAEEQARQGHEVTVLVHASGWRLLPQRQNVNGVDVIRVPYLLRAGFAPVSLIGMWFYHSLIHYDLLHLHMPNIAAVWSVFYSSVCRKPLVVHWHADVITDRWGVASKLLLPLYRLLEHLTLAQSYRVITTSEPYGKASKVLARISGRCLAVPLGMDQAALPEPVQESRVEAEGVWAGDNQPLRLLNIGRLTYYKGQSHLIELMQRTPHAVLCIAGGGELEGDLTRQAQQAGVADRVHLLGPVDEQQKHALLATCDVFVLSSIERTEAFGLVLLEAARYGKPAVAFDIPGSGVGYVVQHEKTGLLVPVGDDDALAVAVGRLHDEPGLRKRLGDHAKARFEEEFSIQMSAAGVQRVYERVLDR